MVQSQRRALWAFAFIVLTALVLATGSSLAVSPGAEFRGGWQPGPLEYHPSRVIVRFADAVTTSAAADSIARMGYSLRNTAEFEPGAACPAGVSIGIVEIPEHAQIDDAIASLSRDPGILYAERDYKHYKAAPRMPSDTRFPETWGLHNENLPPAYKDPRMQGDPVDDADIDAPEAWGMATGSSDMIVAVIDTGIYVYHPDLAANIWVNPGEIPGNGIDDDGNGYIDDVYGWDFFNSDNTVFDPDERDSYGYLNDEHGTHCAGTIGGVADNAMGVPGINWNIKIISLKFIGPDGGYTSDAILAMQYAHNKGAKVISCSWGGGGYEQSLHDAIQATQAIVCCAAGNSGQNTDVYPHYPSSYDCENIISVAASMQNDTPCNYPGWWNTCYGLVSVDLFAPGGYILSTIPPDPAPVPPQPGAEAYDHFYGTSMATPHVSGSSALAAAANPGIPLYLGAPGWSEGMPTIKDAILGSVDVKPAFQGKVATGGRLNIAAALETLGGPIITSAAAEPTFGPPPLAVTFTAAAEPRGAEITDKWWVFGDGSPAVHDYNTTHTYTEQGLFTAEFHVVDADGKERSVNIEIDVFFPPAISVDPTSLEVDVIWDETATRTLTISNEGLGELTYNVVLELQGMIEPTSGKPVKPLGSGGPDAYGYVWMDTDELGSGPPDWGDISDIGTRVTLGADNGVQVDLPFAFPFYGENKTKVNICSNGYLTFGARTTTYTNAAIPTAAEPNDLIAAFWDDLEPQKDNGKVFYYASDEVFIVQYQDVPRFSSGGPYTFQVLLDPSGGIGYIYKTMLGSRLNEATVGIENKTGTVGLQVAFNEDYVHDDLGVILLPSWITVDKTSGTVAPAQSDPLTVTFNASRLPEGYWAATIKIASNDPEHPVVQVPTLMRVESRLAPKIKSIAAQPRAGGAPLEVHFSADAQDPDGQIVGIDWDFGDGSPHATGTLTPVHIYNANGEYRATLTVTDNDGLTASAAVDVLVGDLPIAGVDPASFNRAIRAHRVETAVLTVTNTGAGALNFTASAVTGVSGDAATLGAGGPDGFGYLWKDSDEAGGPVFDWVEISEVGTKLDTLTDDQTATIDLPFEFPFYGQARTTMNVNANGWLNFGEYPSWGTYSNEEIPNTALPNNLLAVYWDDLCIEDGPADAGVYYYDDEAHGRFIVQFNKAPRYSWSGDGGQYTFQAILHPNGTIVYQYLDMQYAPANVDKGTIGIENSNGTDGLGVLHNKRGYMKNGLAIKFATFRWLDVSPNAGTVAPDASMDLTVSFDSGPIASGALDGVIVLDTNDMFNPRITVPVHVEIIPNQAPVITAAAVNPPAGPKTTSFQFVGAGHDPDGHIADKYWTFGDGSDAVHEFVANHAYAADGSYTAKFTVVDEDGYKTSADVAVTVCDPASASWNPYEFSFSVGSGQSISGLLTLANAGPGALVFGKEALLNMAPAPERPAPSGASDPNAKIVDRPVGPAPDRGRSPWLPEDVGSVITSWTCPMGIDPWGVGVLYDSGNLVIADSISDPTEDHVITPEGAYAGISWTADFGGDWAGDMAFDGTYIWQVNVGGDNAVHKIDPADGRVLGSISNSAWTGVSQRGVAYNRNDDTFYIGGWNENIIYKVKGESWDNPGAVIEQWAMADLGIAGLAYHPVANILAVTTSSSTSEVYLVDATSHAVIGYFPIPSGYGAGCEFDADGNLWAAGYDSGKMYLFETGLGAIGGDSWLTWDPTEGTVAAGASREITVTVDAEKLNAGTHRGAVVLYTNDMDHPVIMVPVVAEVAAPPAITEASASPALGEPGMAVAFHAAFTAPTTPVASFGWSFGDGQSAAVCDTTHVYAQPGNYTAVFSVVDEMGASDEASFDIEVKWMPRATVEPTLIEATLAPNATHSTTVAIGNMEGNADLEFSIKIKSGSAPTIAMPERIGAVADPDALTTKGLYRALDPDIVRKIAASIRPNAMGDVVLSWRAPSQIDVPWGLGFSGNVWISDPNEKKDHVVTEQGVHTGDVFNTTWAGAWPADMAYDPGRNLMWQVNVGGDNGIYGLDPETGAVVQSITSGGQWTYTSQRGLAYDAETDTFFIGGWNEDIIYHINGPSHASPGSIIEAFDFPVGIAGLAWHPNGILFVANNGEPDMIYGLDLEALAVLYQFPHPYGGDYSGAGLTLHSDGNLWAASMENKYLYLINTEMPLSSGGILIDPTSGEVEKGTSRDISVTIDAANLGKPGTDVRKYLEITTNDPFTPALFVDVSVHIEAGPTIVSATATPEIGQPPLTVVFDATVEAGAKPITDTWWEFGDGSDPMHALHAEHVYAETGEYEAVLHVKDGNEVEATAEIKITVKWLPTLETYPSSFNETIQIGEQEQTELTVSNTGQAPMDFHVTVAPSFAGSPDWKRYIESNPVKGDYAAEPAGYAGAGAGGPDQFGYIWMDSNQAQGPEFSWIEISEVGTALTLRDDDSVVVNLPFAFPFYGQNKNQVRICSNGYLTFGSAGSKWTNAPIPSAADPNDLLALFWDDLDPSTAGTIYYYYDEPGDQFIVEYKNIAKWRGSQDYTFQAILKPSGVIVYQYLTMDGEVTSATLGIENAAGTDGLQVVYNAAYIQDNLAVSFAPIGGILGVNPTEGYLLPGSAQGVVVTLGDRSALYGTFTLYIYVSANDPFRPFAAIPVTLTINAPPAVTISAPAEGDTVQGVAQIRWTAADPNDAAESLAIDLAWTRDGETWHAIGEELPNTGVFEWNSAMVGVAGSTFRLRAKVTDPAGSFSEFTTGEFTIVNEAPIAKFIFAPSPATMSDTVKFTDKSTDDGAIAAWLWEFGGESTSELQNPEHRYAAKGEFTVKLTVTDNGGLTATAEKKIQVVNVAPTVELLAPEAGAVWAGVRAIRWEASDPDGDTLKIKFEYDYLGDAAEWKLIAENQSNTGQYAWDTSKLAKGGRYKVRITAADPDNATAQAVSGEFTIVVLAHAVVAAPNPARDVVTFFYDIPADGTLHVCDIAGRLIYSAEVSAAENAHEWNLTAGDRPLANGVYLYIVVYDGGKSEVGRLVVNR